jgi:hypothetical protein
MARRLSSYATKVRNNRSSDDGISAYQERQGLLGLGAIIWPWLRLAFFVFLLCILLAVISAAVRLS